MSSTGQWEDLKGTAQLLLAAELGRKVPPASTSPGTILEPSDGRWWTAGGQSQPQLIQHGGRKGTVPMCTRPQAGPAGLEHRARAPAAVVTAPPAPCPVPWGAPATPCLPPVVPRPDALGNVPEVRPMCEGDTRGKRRGTGVPVPGKCGAGTGLPR
jgi:hypothetical protein